MATTTRAPVFASYRTRIYTNPAKQAKWDRVEYRRLVRQRLGMTWRDFKREYPDA